MPNTHQTLQDIADILSFESEKTLLKARLESDSTDWDHLVRVGSSHLVLPAIYCRLKAKKLLHVLPKEMESYLKEITALNRERNQQLLAEAQQISQWFQEAGIDHVFLKGTAMLASGYYKDVAERMVGDLDILIQKNQLIIAKQLLESMNYHKHHNLIYLPKGHRHIPPMTCKSTIGAVELHDNLLIKRARHYISLEKFLNTKQIKNGVAIPSNKNLIHHSILNFQINDKGFTHNLLSLKFMYDFSVILKEIDKLEITNKYLESFLGMCAIFFSDKKNYNSKSYAKAQKLYFFRIKYPFVWHYYVQIHVFFNENYKRLKFAFDINYWNYLFKKIILKEAFLNTPQN